MSRLHVSAAVLLGLLAAAPAHADICAVDQRPGATLLVPWFAVDRDQVNGLSTRVWVRNVSTSPTLANVTLWSDYGVAAFWFNVYLPAYGTERIDLGALLREGRMPRTGAGVSGLGSFDTAATPQNFPNCHAGTTVGVPPVYADSASCTPAKAASASCNRRAHWIPDAARGAWCPPRSAVRWSSTQRRRATSSATGTSRSAGVTPHVFQAGARPPPGRHHVSAYSTLMVPFMSAACPGKLQKNL